jgi:hypothetical protein
MTKQDIQKRVLQNGEILDLSKFTWDEENRIFSTVENDLVLDFNGIDNVIFKTGSRCTFKTGSRCTFKTGGRCTFKTGYNCTFDTGDWCTVITGGNGILHPIKKLKILLKKLKILLKKLIKKLHIQKRI